MQGAPEMLVLGSIVFRDFEIPEEIQFGMRQAKHVHKHVGGGRIVDAMGPDPEPIRWRGRFRGPTAPSRARACERLAGSGRQVGVSWGSFYYVVLVDLFEADYKSFREIPYHIECTVVGSGAGGGIVSSLTDLIGADIGSMLSLTGAL